MLQVALPCAVVAAHHVSPLVHVLQGIYENFIVDKSVPDVGPKLEKGWPEGFESHPNGDSVKFQKIYGIPECDNLIRGTYRNIGWCSTMFKISQLGLLSEDACAVRLPPPCPLTHTHANTHAARCARSTWLAAPAIPFSPCSEALKKKWEDSVRRTPQLGQLEPLSRLLSKSCGKRGRCGCTGTGTDILGPTRAACNH